MRIHKEGLKVFRWFFPLTLVFVLAINLIWPVNNIWHYLFYVLLAVKGIWTVSFFRVPERVVNKQPNAVLSAADGKVVAIEEVVEHEFFKDKRIQVSVFMSPMNVHVNWYPVDGKVTYTQYHPGKFLVAWHPKSSELNERSTIVLECADGKALLMRQIAGFLARRIVYKAQVGDKAIQGNEFGIIRFGSRVDLFLPVGSKVKVKIGQKVTGQKTIIAEL